jgi:hypothetical protein
VFITYTPGDKEKFIYENGLLKKINGMIFICDDVRAVKKIVEANPDSYFQILTTAVNHYLFVQQLPTDRNMSQQKILKAIAIKDIQ